MAISKGVVCAWKGGWSFWCFGINSDSEEGVEQRRLRRDGGMGGKGLIGFRCGPWKCRSETQERVPKMFRIEVRKHDQLDDVGFFSFNGFGGRAGRSHSTNSANIASNTHFQIFTHLHRAKNLVIRGGVRKVTKDGDGTQMGTKLISIW